MSSIEKGKEKGGSDLDPGTDTGTPGPGSGTMTGAERNAGKRGKWPGCGLRMIGKERGSSGRTGLKAGTRGIEVSKANGRPWRPTQRPWAAIRLGQLPFQPRTQAHADLREAVLLQLELESVSVLGRCRTVGHRWEGKPHEKSPVWCLQMLVSPASGKQRPE